MNGGEVKNQAGLGRWLAARWRLALTIALLTILFVLSRCSPTAMPVTEAVTAEPETGYLRVEVRPHGAQVLVDGLRSGTTPISAELAAGFHTIRVEAPGHQPLAKSVELAGGEEVVLDGQLAPLDVAEGPSTTPAGAPTQPATAPSLLPDLVVKQVRIEIETVGPCMVGPAPLGVRAVIGNEGRGDAGPFGIEINDTQVQVRQGITAGETATFWVRGYISGGENRVLVDAASQVGESNEDNNLFSQMVPIPTPLPTCTPTPTPTASNTPASSPAPTLTPPPPSPQPLSVHEGQITIPTYPFADFVREAHNETYNMTYPALDWASYETSHPAPREVTYRSLVVENEYLQLTFLPDVGGRLYQVVYKPTGHNQAYRNPVLKPSPWGPSEQGWWLAAGGIEWCLPVEEHGYEWGVPWQISTQRDAEGVTVILRDTEAADRVRAEIAVRLETGAAAFSIRPRLENPTGGPLDVKYWTNAMLAPGGRNAPSADLRFVLPKSVTAVTVHSRGDDGLPGPNQSLSWPAFQGRDLSRLGNWNRWLGFFEDPARAGYMAVYDEGYGEGLVRIFPADVARGAKIFAFGWTDPIPPQTWTDDGSSYVEIHGGPAPTFDECITLPAGGSLQWTETWYPVAGLERLCFANETAALGLHTDGQAAHVGVAVPHPWAGTLRLLREGQEQWQQAVSLQPGEPYQTTVPLAGSEPRTGWVLHLEDADGQTAAQLRAEDCAHDGDQD